MLNTRTCQLILAQSRETRRTGGATSSLPEPGGRACLSSVAVRRMDRDRFSRAEIAFASGSLGVSETVRFFSKSPNPPVPKGTWNCGVADICHATVLPGNSGKRHSSRFTRCRRDGARPSLSAWWTRDMHHACLFPHAESVRRGEGEGQRPRCPNREGRAPSRPFRQGGTCFRCRESWSFGDSTVLLQVSQTPPVPKGTWNCVGIFTPQFCGGTRGTISQMGLRGRKLGQRINNTLASSRNRATVRFRPAVASRPS